MFNRFSTNGVSVDGEQIDIMFKVIKKKDHYQP